MGDDASMMQMHELSHVEVGLEVIAEVVGLLPDQVLRVEAHLLVSVDGLVEEVELVVVGVLQSPQALLPAQRHLIMLLNSHRLLFLYLHLRVLVARVG